MGVENNRILYLYFSENGFKKAPTKTLTEVVEPSLKYLDSFESKSQILSIGIDNGRNIGSFIVWGKSEKLVKEELEVNIIRVLIQLVNEGKSDFEKGIVETLQYLKKNSSDLLEFFH